MIKRLLLMINNEIGFSMIFSQKAKLVMMGVLILGRHRDMPRQRDVAVMQVFIIVIIIHLLSLLFIFIVVVSICLFDWFLIGLIIQVEILAKSS